MERLKLRSKLLRVWFSIFEGIVFDPLYDYNRFSCSPYFFFHRIGEMKHDEFLKAGYERITDPEGIMGKVVVWYRRKKI